MHGDVSYWPAASEACVGDPGPWAAESGIVEFRLRQQRFADTTRGNDLPHAVYAALETKVLRNAEKHSLAICGCEHAFAFGGIHCHRFLAEHRLAMLNREQNVFKVQGVGRGHKDCIHIR